jgi:hypothetical protein
MRRSVSIWLCCLATLATAAAASPPQQCALPGDRHSPAIPCSSSLDVCVAGACHHKALFPLVTADWMATAVLFVASVVSVLSGVGGGGLFVPLLLFLEVFPSEQAVPLSKVGALLPPYFGASTSRCCHSLSCYCRFRCMSCAGHDPCGCYCCKRSSFCQQRWRACDRPCCLSDFASSVPGELHFRVLM